MQLNGPESGENLRLQSKYDITALFYDILDYPWERVYRRWRPGLLEDVHGRVLEAGVGTGRNLKYYPADVDLTAIDLSPAMLRRASRRAEVSARSVDLRHEDAAVMGSVPSAHFDWVVSTFLCCVMPDSLQPQAIAQFARVLRPGGRFRLLEIVYSRQPWIRRRQKLFAPFVEKVYGARFDRQTLSHVRESRELRVDNTFFLKADTYLVIEGTRIG